ncbi:hypothetical protein Bbelb_339870 [Branchiostoma belcheri]|nr:hypothetical protein Bbelb_339870 [Branchiostoma belcheri]
MSEVAPRWLSACSGVGDGVMCAGSVLTGPSGGDISTEINFLLRRVIIIKIDPISLQSTSHLGTRNLVSAPDVPVFGSPRFLFPATEKEGTSKDELATVSRGDLQAVDKRWKVALRCLLTEEAGLH